MNKAQLAQTSGKQHTLGITAAQTHVRRGDSGSGRASSVVPVASVLSVLSVLSAGCEEYMFCGLLFALGSTRAR